MKKTPIEIGEKVFTYAYPNSRLQEPKNGFQRANFAPNYYEGTVVSIEQRNDMFFKGTCIQTNMQIKGGASGGPVFNKAGYVVGINSTGYDMPESEEPISFITPIQKAFEIEYPLNLGKGKRNIKFIELEKLGIIELEE